MRSCASLQLQRCFFTLRAGVPAMTTARVRWQKAARKARLADAFATVQKRSDAGTLGHSDIARAEQRRELRAAFDSVDTDRGGTLSVDEIGELLTALGQTNTQAELRVKMREIDADGSGTLDFEEFVAAMDKWQEEELHDIFNFFNTDDDGYISLDELRSTVKSVGLQLSEQAFLNLAATIDEDGSGQIDAAEFCSFMKPLMSFAQQHSFTAKQLPDRGEVHVTVNTIGIVLTGHSNLPFIAFKLEGEDIRPVVGLIKSSATEAMVSFEVNRKGAEESVVVSLEMNSASDASLLVQKVVEAEARKSLRRKVAHNKQMLALKEAFDDVDTDGSNQLDVEELGELLTMLGQEFTRAELLDKVRQLDEDGSGMIEFPEFVTLMTTWQQEELRDMFAYFDGDLSDTLDQAEIGSCLSALGQDLTPEEVASLTAQVDSDGSDLIDVDEFVVFMRPFLNIAQKYQYKLHRSSDSAETIFSVSSVGVQLTVDGSATRLGYARIKEVRLDPDSLTTLVLEVKDVDGPTLMRFYANYPGLCEDIVGIVAQQVAKQHLRRQVQLYKQKLQLRNAFTAIDTSGDGRLDLDELRLLLQTLGQELSDAGLRDKVRELTSSDGSESIDFDQFASFMFTWQNDQLNDVFEFFDDDETGTISVSELSECILALGNSVDEEEAHNLAAHVDSDGSGEIEREEFFVFMRPLMSISQKADYIVYRVDEAGVVQNHETIFSVGLLGVQLTDGQSQVSYSFFAIVGVADSPRLILTILRFGEETQIAFQSHESSSIIANIRQQQARLKLIRDIQVDKQQREVKPVFEMFDEDGSGEIATGELRILLETLGQSPTDAQINSRIKRYDLDNSGAINFDEFVLWMTELQDKEIEDAFNMFDKDGSGSISVRELQQLVKAMGEQMTDSEVLQLAKHVDSDGSGEIELDELKILLIPMMSLTDHASFYVELEPNYGICGGTAHLVVSGLGLQLRPEATTNFATLQEGTCQCVHCQREITTIGYSKVMDIPERDQGLCICARSRIGELLEVKVVCDNSTRQAIFAAVKRQQGKLSLRSAIARSMEPKDSTLETALLILRIEPESRTQAQLNMLHKFLTDNDMFAEMELETELQQMQCCRYLHADRYAAGDVIFKEGDVVWDVYHIIEGVVSVRKAGVEVRQQWKGASFGPLTVTGKLTASRSPTIVCIMDCALVRLSRADYLRICGALKNEVIKVLGKPPKARSDPELAVLLGFLHDTHLFRVLYYELLQRAICRVVRLETIGKDTIVGQQSGGGDSFRVILNGRIEMVTNQNGKRKKKMLSSGESIGYECVIGRTQESSGTTTTTEETTFGTLTRNEFVYVSETIGESIVQILDKIPSKRSAQEVEKIYSLFSQFPFLIHLRSKLLQRHCCRHFSCRRIAKGETLFEQGDIGDAMYIVLSGSMSVKKWRGANNSRSVAGRRGETARCQIGTAFGESSVLATTEFAQRRVATVQANEESVLAVLSRDIYQRIKRTSELQVYIDQFWDMLMNDTFAHERDLSTDFCEEKTYKNLHLAIGKSIHPDWTPDEALEEVQRDWLRDIARHNSGNDVLNHNQFSDALFELVDEWCGTISMKMYVTFLSTVYDNIKHFWKTDEKSGKDKFVLAPIGNIQCVESSLSVLQEEGEKIRKRDNQELDKVYRQNRAGTNSEKDALFRVFTEQRIKHASEGHLALIKKTHRTIANVKMNLLRNKYGAKYASKEEEAYFLELLALRVLGEPQWTEEHEHNFRSQLQANMNELDSDKLVDVLNDLQECIIAGSPRDEAELSRCKSEAEQALDALLGSGVGIIDGARDCAIREMMRLACGPPHWLIEDQERFEHMLDMCTAPTSGATVSDKRVVFDESNTDRGTPDGQNDGTGALSADSGRNTNGGNIRSNIVWGQKRQLPGGFAGRVGAHISEGGAAAAKRQLEQLEQMDLSHVAAKIDTGNHRRRRRKRGKKEKKPRRRQRVKAQSVASFVATAGQLPPIKRSASVPPRLHTRNGNAKDSQTGVTAGGLDIEEKRAKKLLKRQRRRERLALQAAARRQHEREQRLAAELTSGRQPRRQNKSSADVALPPVLRMHKVPSASVIGFMG
eukprot:COSAG02_NODE_1783_length_10942_cov_1025.230266_3_plen_2086_part_00